VTKHPFWTLAVIAMVTLGGVACKSQKSAEEQKKIDELQSQLDDAKKQLAAKEEAAKAAEPPPAAPESAPQAPPPPPPSSNAAAASKPSAGKPAPGAAKPNYVTAEQGQKAADQYSQDKEKVKGAFAEQQAVNEKQADTNQQVQAQIEEMKPREFTIPAGTVIPVRTTTELSTKTLSNGSVFDALLEKALVVGDTTIAPQGAHVTGVVVSSDPGGRVKGVASLDVAIRSIAGARDHTIRVKSDTFSAVADTSKGRDAKRTGIMAGAGAAIGAIAGGGKGAAIGLGAGAATGVGVNMATRGKDAIIPAETLIEFKLQSPVTVVWRH